MGYNADDGIPKDALVAPPDEFSESTLVSLAMTAKELVLLNIKCEGSA